MLELFSFTNNPPPSTCVLLQLDGGCRHRNNSVLCIVHQEETELRLKKDSSMFVLKFKEEQWSSASERTGSNGVYGKCALDLEQTKAA